MSFAHHVEPGKSFKLTSLDASDHGGITHEHGMARIAELGSELESLEEILFAAGMNGLLIVLQGRDTSGKDGAIRNLLQYVNVQSCRVAAFKVPTPEEISHDFLWRIHAATPAKGGVTIFNRSHYEDVLAVRVHKLVPESVWKKRYDTINHFENLLADSGIIVVKFYLQITKDEQERRLLDREKDPLKSWKLSVGDWKERELWDDYTEAYEDALTKCSTEVAPWYVVPANHKWFRDLCIVERLVHTLRPYRDDWQKHLEGIGVTARKELAVYRQQGK